MAKNQSLRERRQAVLERLAMQRDEIATDKATQEPILPRRAINGFLAALGVIGVVGVSYGISVYSENQQEKAVQPAVDCTVEQLESQQITTEALHSAGADCLMLVFGPEVTSDQLGLVVQLAREKVEATQP
jgi:hypothetical protein